MNLDDAAEAAHQIKTRRLVHKPAVLIWAACRATAGLPRLTRWSDAQGDLAAMITALCGGQGMEASALPVLALRSSPLWEVESADEVTAPSDPRALRWLQSKNPRFGLSEPVYELVRQDTESRDRFAVAAVKSLEWGRAVDVLRHFDIEATVFRGIGEVPGVEVGRRVAKRWDLVDLAIHRAPQSGIVGNGLSGAESIVISGGYEDDEDYGDVIVYTGHGGQEQNTKRQIADQDPRDPGNAALITSSLTGAPVRVIRGADRGNPYAPDDGLRYDGLYWVESYWQERGASGYLMCRYRLVRCGSGVAIAPMRAVSEGVFVTLPEGNAAPGRSTTVANKINRSHAVAETVKKMHGYACQICDVALVVAGRGFAEGAHVRALGRPHDGPDKTNNMLCLCPNCHVLFDKGEILIADDLAITSPQPHRQFLRTVTGHAIDRSHLAYHRSIHLRA